MAPQASPIPSQIGEECPRFTTTFLYRPGPAPDKGLDKVVEKDCLASLADHRVLNKFSSTSSAASRHEETLPQAFEFATVNASLCGNNAHDLQLGPG